MRALADGVPYMAVRRREKQIAQLIKYSTASAEAPGQRSSPSGLSTSDQAFLEDMVVSVSRWLAGARTLAHARAQLAGAHWGCGRTGVAWLGRLDRDPDGSW